MKISILLLTATTCFGQVKDHAFSSLDVEDPLIRSLERYGFQQADKVVMSSLWYYKYRKVLGIDNDQFMKLSDAGMNLRTYNNAWEGLQDKRDNYIRTLKILSREQRWRLHELYYVEYEPYEFLIIPSIQRDLRLSDLQKEKIESLFMDIPAKIKELSGTEHSFQADEQIKSKIHRETSSEMLDLLTNEQREEVVENQEKFKED